MNCVSTMCQRTYCPNCQQEMIHRDHRQYYESASALGQLMHRQGPNELTVGDIDLYVNKCAHGLIRLIEHKQPDQKIDGAQHLALSIIDECIQIAIHHPSDNLNKLIKNAPYSKIERLHSDSGVFIIRGLLEPATTTRREVDFASKQTIEKLDRTVVLAPKTRKELYDWINGGDSNWTPRRGRWRRWR